MTMYVKSLFQVLIVLFLLIGIKLEGRSNIKKLQNRYTDVQVLAVFPFTYF